MAALAPAVSGLPGCRQSNPRGPPLNHAQSCISSSPLVRGGAQAPMLLALHRRGFPIGFGGGWTGPSRGFHRAATSSPGLRMGSGGLGFSGALKGVPVTNPDNPGFMATFIVAHNTTLHCTHFYSCMTHHAFIKRQHAFTNPPGTYVQHYTASKS